MSVNGIEIRYGQNWMSSEGTRLRVKELGQDYAVLEESSGRCGYFHMDGVCKKNPSVRLVRLVEDPMTAKGVKGIELEVGQRWLTNQRAIVRIEEVSASANELVAEETGQRAVCTADGFFIGQHHIFLMELIEDAPTATLTEPIVIGDDPIADAALDQLVASRKAPASAPDLLEAAAGHMRDRAATYDKPEGERSMAQTVAIFNLHHGAALTEAQGWHFMQILKDVRLFTNVAQPHRDSCEDGVAYSALKAEALLKGGAQ